MNAAAANALLKTLEEPPPGTYLILVSDEPGRMPATLRSRCRKLAAPVPPEPRRGHGLLRRESRRPSWRLPRRPARRCARSRIADPAVQDERRRLARGARRARALSVPALAARIDAGGKDERRARLAHALEWLIAWTADLARIAAGGAARLNPEPRRRSQRLAARVAPLALFRYHRSLLQQRAMHAHPLQPRLVAEAMLLDYRALF